jgi:DNA polymerase-3 subunit gamma/tau
VQSLLEQAVYKPVQGRFKVFMIDEVHMLTNTAFNSMLKTLEEPPEYLKFVLATTDPQKVPVTVLSRCLQFNLRPMAPETITEHLAQVLKTEAVESELPALRLLARAAHGSMRDALSLTDQAIAFGSGKLEAATVRQMLGSVDRSYVYRLIEALAKGDGKTVVEISEELRLHGLSAASTLEEMSMVLQRMAVAQVVPDATDDTDPDAADLSRLAALMPADETQLLYSLCLHGRADLGLAPDEYAALTMVLLRLLAFKPGAAAQNSSAEKKTLKSPEAAASQVQAPAEVHRQVVPSGVPQGRVLPVVSQPRSQAMAVGQSSSSASSDTKVVAVPVRQQTETRADAAITGQASSAPLVPTEEGDFWHLTVSQLVASEAVTALVRELALQSQLIARDSDSWLLRVERESLNSGTSRERLQAALQGTGQNVTLRVEIGRVTDSPYKRNAAAIAEKQVAAEKIIFEDPFVQSMMREFGAKIVPGSIKPN